MNTSYILTLIYNKSINNKLINNNYNIKSIINKMSFLDFYSKQLSSSKD